MRSRSPSSEGREGNREDAYEGFIRVLSSFLRGSA